MKLSVITEAQLIQPSLPSFPAGRDRANMLRAALSAGIPSGTIYRMFGISRARLSQIRRRLRLMGWEPGMPISREMLTHARGKR